MADSVSELGLFAVARPVRGEFTYRVPDEMRAQLTPGMRVQVPFGRGLALAFYLGDAPVPPPDVLAKVKVVERVLETTPAFPKEIVELVRFAANHYRAPLGEALRGALPPGMTKPKVEREVRPDHVDYVEALPSADLSVLKRAPAQHATLSYVLAVGGRASLEEVAHAIPGAREHVRSLVQRGFMRIDAVEIAKEVKAGLFASRHMTLTEEQTHAVEVLGRALDLKSFQPFLLHGVTGSGKTEVYLQLAERALAQGRGALILVPEIALTPQLVGRFQSRFGTDVAVLHSALKDKERLLHWQNLRFGRVRLAVGVRSAIFAPVQNVGLVVVDEEHDPSFKQDEKLKYQARDLAVVRAQHAGALVVLGSATPSFETLENVKREKYGMVQLTKRVDDRPMPSVELVDLRVVRPRTPESRNEEPAMLSEPLRVAMAETLERGQQVILFLNRRGHSTFITCEVCGRTVKCPDCDVCMTYHQGANQLRCHYCGRAEPLPDTCADCSGPLLKLGVGTERIEAEVAALFPEARVARLDRDAASHNERLTDLLAAFARREIDVLVGTQMVAKGHDFPGVTLVCVVLADTALALPDFRAAERTFQLLTQVSGRAGRGTEPGRVLIQSYAPEASAVAAVLRNDFAGFSAAERERRKQLAWPPFSRTVALRIEGESASATQGVAEKIGAWLGKGLDVKHGVRLLGPAPAPISRIKGRSRWQIVLKAPTHAALSPLLNALEGVLPKVPRNVSVDIDVDPGALL